MRLLKKIALGMFPGYTKRPSAIWPRVARRYFSIRSSAPPGGTVNEDPQDTFSGKEVPLTGFPESAGGVFCPARLRNRSNFPADPRHGGGHKDGHGVMPHCAAHCLRRHPACRSPLPAALPAHRKWSFCRKGSSAAVPRPPGGMLSLPDAAAA